MPGPYQNSKLFNASGLCDFPVFVAIQEPNCSHPDAFTSAPVAPETVWKLLAGEAECYLSPFLQSGLGVLGSLD